MNINAVDLFCGVGGLTYGVQQAGINVVAGYDIEESCRYAYEYNNDAIFINKDIKKVKSIELEKLYPKNTDIKILMGCAPCQPFSSYSYKYKNNKKTKNKMDLLYYFGKNVELLKPDIVSMENVPQLVKEDVFVDFVNILKNNGYYVEWKIVFAPDYGVPQNRKRLLLLASKLGKIELIKPLYDKKQYRTTRDTIYNLPPLISGEEDSIDFLHRCRKLSLTNLKRIKQSVPGGTWNDWDENLLPECYKRESGKSFSSVYGRLEWDKPAPTLTTQFMGYGNGRFGHPEQDRALSLREGAMLQTFPQNYRFVEKKEDVVLNKLTTQIGNAVPPKLGEIIGLSIMKHLKEIFKYE